MDKTYFIELLENMVPGPAAGETKIAKFSKKFKNLEYWTSGNTYTTVNATSMKQVRAIIKRSGIEQKLEVTS